MGLSSWESSGIRCITVVLGAPLPPESSNWRHLGAPAYFMALDWSQCPAVESIPGKVSGAWVFRGTRIPVAAVFENLEDGLTIDEITRMFDGLTPEQVKTVLDFTVQSLETPAPTRWCLSSAHAPADFWCRECGKARKLHFGGNSQQ